MKEEYLITEFDCVTPDELLLNARVMRATKTVKVGGRYERDLMRDRIARFHFWHESDTILSDLNRRMQGYSRPYTFYRKAVLPTLIDELGLDTDTKFRWSDYLGCSCPCSPGFRCYSEKLRGCDVSVLVKSL